MVVTDNFLFPSSAMMKVRVTNMNGVDSIVEVGKDWTCDKVKLALEHLLDLPPSLTGLSSDALKNSLMFRLVLVRTGKPLSDDSTLAQQGVRENDELLLLKKRMQVPVMETDRQRDEKKVPDAASIRRATAHLSRKHHDSQEEEPSSNTDFLTLQFQSELRRILISLIEASQRILCLNPEAAKILKQAEDLLNEAQAKKVDLSEASVKQLTDMGFPENRARKSLLLNQHSVVTAMEWLLTNESDPDIDTPLPSQDPETSDSAAVASVEDAPTADPEEGTASESVEGATGGTEAPRFKNILETIRAFQHREFRPDPHALQNLIEMGFIEKEAVYALRMSRNNQAAAVSVKGVLNQSRAFFTMKCDWLLSDRKESPETIDQGLDPNSPVYKAILAHPNVQLGLNNPRCLLAFLQMLENPLSASQWLSDPETGPLLMQISRIYHSEKLTPSSSDTESSDTGS